MMMQTISICELRLRGEKFDIDDSSWFDQVTACVVYISRCSTHSYIHKRNIDSFACPYKSCEILEK